MIRQAVPDDAAKAIPLLLQAMGCIASILTAATEAEEMASVLHEFFRREDNRVSHQNTMVLEIAAEVVGVAVFYDGARARELDAPLERAAARRSGHAGYRIPTEPEPTEFYLDTVSVSHLWQGKGYGTRLVEAACDRARERGHTRMALLVGVEHAKAKRLYERLGFFVSDSKSISGQEYFHMVRHL